MVGHKRLARPSHSWLFVALLRSCCQSTPFCEDAPPPTAKQRQSSKRRLHVLLVASTSAAHLRNTTRKLRLRHPSPHSAHPDQPWQTYEMAMLSNNYHSSSSNYRRSPSEESSGRRSGANTTASAYIVDASTMALTGFHYSTCGAGGMSHSHPHTNGTPGYHKLTLPLGAGWLV